MTGQHVSTGHGGERISDGVRAIGIVLLLTVALGVIFIAFGWPAANTAPREVPIGVTGPAAQVSMVTQKLDQAAPGAFAVTSYPSQSKLEEATRDRVIYGGFVLTAPAPIVVTATGGSPAVAQTLGGIAQQMGTQLGVTVTVRDLAPLPASDQRGTGLAAAALPMTLGGMLPAVILTLAFPGRNWLKAAAATGFSALAALTITVILHMWFGVITTNIWSVAAGLGLGMTAMSLSILGLGALLGRPGLGLGSALAVLVGNPLSGLNSAPEFLPQGLGLLGQLLPPGANGTLLRSTAYFDGAGGVGAILILCCWAGLGLALLAVDAARVRQADVPAPAVAPTLAGARG